MLELLKAARLCDTICPATLKLRSDGALVAITHKTSRAVWANFGSCSSWIFHHDKRSKTSTHKYSMIDMT